MLKTNSLKLIVTSKKYNFLYFLILLTFLTVYSLYANRTLGVGHDMSFHYHRLMSLMDALKEGRFPWYISYDVIGGSGYFFKAFYPDLLLVPFAFVGLCTDIYIAYFVMIFTLTILCGISTYWCVDRLTNNYTAALFAALLYTFCAYRIFDVFTRCALGEVFSFTIFPIIVVGAYEVIRGNYKKWYILTIGFSLVLFSHAVSSAVIFILLIIFILFSYKFILITPKRLLYLVLAGVSTLLIISIYFLPLLEQFISNTFYVTGEANSSIPDEITSIISLQNTIKGLFTGWVYLDVPYIFNIKVGMLLLIPLLLRVFVREKNTYIRIADRCVLIGIIFLIFTCTKLLWQIWPFTMFYFIQFPWRLLQYTSFFFAIAGGIYMTNLLIFSYKKYIVAGLGLLIIATIFITSEASNFTTRQINEDNVITMYDLKDRLPLFEIGANEYIPDKTPKSFVDKITADPEYKKTFTNHLHNYKINRGIISFNTSDNNLKEYTEIPILYYKGYEAKANDINIDIRESNRGLVEVKAYTNQHIEVYYAGTFIQKLSTWITIISVLLFTIFIIYQEKKKKK